MQAHKQQHSLKINVQIHSLHYMQAQNFGKEQETVMIMLIY